MSEVSEVSELARVCIHLRTACIPGSTPSVVMAQGPPGGFRGLAGVDSTSTPQTLLEYDRV